MKSIAVVGGGSAGIAFASFIDGTKYKVTIYEKNKALGRKFLVAGKGGFNLTHSEPISLMKSRFIPEGFLDQSLDQFTNEDFRAYLESIGIPTFVGTSGRVFPVSGIKPIQVLDAMLSRLKVNGVSIKTNYNWEGENLADIMVFSLGGGSWKVTGSDGNWIKFFEKTKPFKASNCGFTLDLPSTILEEIGGKPLKNIVLHIDPHSAIGEIMLTDTGMEGGAVYAVSHLIQAGLHQNKSVKVEIDLKKDLTSEQILAKFHGSKEKTVSSTLRQDVKLSSQAIKLLKTITKKEEFQNTAKLTSFIKRLPLRILAPAPIDQAISTTGGIPLAAINNKFEMINKPNYYIIGEMLDWDAPTGGYLLQACFSMGHFVATNLNALHP